MPSTEGPCHDSSRKKSAKPALFLLVAAILGFVGVSFDFFWVLIAGLFFLAICLYIAFKRD